MRIIHWICSHMRLDRIRNVVIRDKVEETPIEDKMREAILQWYVKRRRADAQVRRCEKIELPEGKKGRRRPSKSWNEVIRHDLKTLGLAEDMAQRLWTARFKVVDFR